jgi:hypothetical protein
MELAFTAGEEVSLSEACALQLMKEAIEGLAGNGCTEASPGGIRKAFRAATKLAGVLLIVDNVHSESQVGLLLQDIVDTNAMVIFTSRSEVPLGGGAHADTWAQVCWRRLLLAIRPDQRTLQVHKRLHMHRLESLSLEDALQLFREGWQRPNSISEAVEKELVTRCGGLPLALLIVKGAVRKQTKEADWLVCDGVALSHVLLADCVLRCRLVQKADLALRSGERDPCAAALGQSENFLQKTMQYSLQGLPPHAVCMFLDAACVMFGRAEADILMAWQGWHGDDAHDLELLKSRHLVTVDAAGNLQVHDVLRWFGRRVVLGKAGIDPALHGRRLWVVDGKIVGHGPQVSSQSEHPGWCRVATSCTGPAGISLGSMRARCHTGCRPHG